MTRMEEGRGGMDDDREEGRQLIKHFHPPNSIHPSDNAEQAAEHTREDANTSAKDAHGSLVLAAVTNSMRARRKQRWMAAWLPAARGKVEATSQCAS